MPPLLYGAICSSGEAHLALIFRNPLLTHSSGGTHAAPPAMCYRENTLPHEPHRRQPSLMRLILRTLIPSILAALALILLAACEPEPAEAPTAMPTEAEVEDRQAPLGNAAPLEGSDFTNVTLWVDDAETTGASEGAEAGSLVLTLTLQNQADSEQTLDLSREDYVLLTADGLPLEAVIVSDQLIEPELEAGESVTGTAEFSTVDVGSSYTLSVTDFEDIVVDASVAPEPLD